MTDVLEGLSKAEKQRLLDRLTFELEKPAGTNRFTKEDIELWECLGDVLADFGYRGAPLKAFTENYGVANYQDVGDRIHAYVTAACGGGVLIRKPLRMQVTRVALRCLARYLMTRDIPISAKSMLNSAGQLAGAVDRCFPGYAASGLLARVAPLVKTR